MTVADLIRILADHNPNATVVFADTWPTSEGGVLLLSASEVQDVDLGRSDDSGLFELWREGAGCSGPVPGVLLGAPP